MKIDLFSERSSVLPFITYSLFLPPLSLTVDVQMISKLRKALREDFCGLVSVSRFPGHVSSPEDLVAVDFEPVDDPDLETARQARRQAQKRQREV